MNRQELEEKLQLPGEDAIEILTKLKIRGILEVYPYIFENDSYFNIYEASPVSRVTAFCFRGELELVNPKYSRNYLTVNELSDQILEKILDNEGAQIILKEALE